MFVIGIVLYFDHIVCCNYFYVNRFFSDSFNFKIDTYKYFKMSLKQWTFFHLCITATFLISGFIISLIQGFLYFFLRILNKNLYRRINYYIFYSIYSCKFHTVFNFKLLIFKRHFWIIDILFLIEWWSYSSLTVYANKEDFHNFFGKEHAFVIINHYYLIDWMVIFYFGDGVKIVGVSNIYLNFCL